MVYLARISKTQKLVLASQNNLRITHIIIFLRQKPLFMHGSTETRNERRELHLAKDTGIRRIYATNNSVVWYAAHITVILSGVYIFHSRNSEHG